MHHALHPPRIILVQNHQRPRKNRDRVQRQPRLNNRHESPLALHLQHDLHAQRLLLHQNAQNHAHSPHEIQQHLHHQTLHQKKTNRLFYLHVRHHRLYVFFCHQTMRAFSGSRGTDAGL